MCVNKLGSWDASTLVYVSPSVSVSAWYNVSVQLDGTHSIPEIYAFEVLDNPVFKTFENGRKTYVGEVLQIAVRLYIIIVIVVSI